MSVEARRIRRLHNALSTLDFEPIEVIPLADPAPWSAFPRSFKVTTANHGAVKVRLMGGPRRGRRVTTLARKLSDPRLPEPLGFVGNTTVERWIDGVELTSMPLRANHVDAAADLLSTIHAFPGTHQKERLPRRRQVAPWAAHAGPQLTELADADRLTRSESRQLQRIIDEGLPTTSAWGLTHTDFCAVNLVLGEDGTLFSIDNEHLGRGFLEFDVARVWYRWPMPEWAERRFAQRYRSRGPEPPAAEQAAWRAMAALMSAHARNRIGAPDADALEALRQLLDEPLTQGR